MTEGNSIAGIHESNHSSWQGNREYFAGGLPLRPDYSRYLTTLPPDCEHAAHLVFSFESSKVVLAVMKLASAGNRCIRRPADKLNPYM